jgi:putative aldouronate transport system permease protein
MLYGTYGQPPRPRRRFAADRLARAVFRDRQIYVLLLPALIFFILFCYRPMYGAQVAFRDFKAAFGITGSKWVGLKHFRDFFSAYYCGRLFANTFLLNFYGLIFGFPVPLVLAILLNQVEKKRFRQFTQTVLYVPHFISTVVLAGMLYLFLSPTNGIVNHLITSLGGKSIYFMIETGWFRPLFIGSDIWQNAGWNTILYLAALTAISPELYEAATIDGANKRQKILYIEIPHLIPIATMMLILNCGTLLSSNTDKALLLQTSGNMKVSDIIGVYQYTVGIQKQQFSYTSAIGLCLNALNFAIILLINAIARRAGEISLF